MGACRKVVAITLLIGCISLSILLIACESVFSPLPTRTPLATVPAIETPRPTATRPFYTVTIKVLSTENKGATLIYGHWFTEYIFVNGSFFTEDNVLDVELPYERTFENVEANKYISIDAIDNSWEALITCQIWLDGKLWISETNSGRTGFDARLPDHPYTDCGGNVGKS